MATCSGLSRTLGEPLHATATFVESWLLVEDTGPWGRKALLESGLDPGLGAELERRGKEAGVRVGLVRSFGRERGFASRRMLVASSRPGSSFLELASVHDPRELLELDLERVGRGEPTGRGELSPQPVYLVCTNGRRDPCCGRLGRDLARALKDSLGERLWECSHVGGHRFAPNLVALPHGLFFGRLEPERARRVVAAVDEGRITLESYRGRSSLAPAAQAAEAFVRDRSGLDGLDEVEILELEDAGDGESDVLLRAGGDDLLVRVRRRTLEPRPTSCGGSPEQPAAWQAYSVSPR
jgi:hypothetical protein